MVLCLQILHSVIIISILHYLGSTFGCFLMLMQMKTFETNHVHFIVNLVSMQPRH